MYFLPQDLEIVSNSQLDVPGKIRLSCDLAEIGIRDELLQPNHNSSVLKFLEAGRFRAQRVSGGISHGAGAGVTDRAADTSEIGLRPQMGARNDNKRYRIAI
jgi:hypothetical protein